MIKALLQTYPDYVFAFLRTTAGIVIWPYGCKNFLVGLAEWESRERLKKWQSRRFPNSLPGWLSSGVFWKHCANLWLFGENRSWWFVHYLYWCALIFHL